MDGLFDALDGMQNKPEVEKESSLKDPLGMSEGNEGGDDDIDTSQFTQEESSENEETGKTIENDEVLSVEEQLESLKNKETDKLEKESQETEEGVIDTSAFEQDETTQEEAPESTESTSPVSGDVLLSLASALNETGAYSSSISDEELEELKKAENPVEAFLELNSKKIEESRYSDLNENQRLYLEALENGIPEQQIQQRMHSHKIYNSIDPESLDDDAQEETRKALIRNHYQAQGVAPEKAEKLAQKSVDLGEDIEESKEALDFLKKFETEQLKAQTEQQKELKKKQQEEAKKKAEEIKEEILSTKEIFPGHNINKRTAEKLYENMTTVVGHDKQGNPMNVITKARSENPEEFDKKLHYLFHVTNGLKDLSYFGRKQKTSAVKELEEQLSHNSDVKVTGGKAIGDGNASSGGVLQALKKMKF